MIFDFDADFNDKTGPVFSLDGRFYLLLTDTFYRIDHWIFTLILK
jgi:hypothetical protein